VNQSILVRLLVIGAEFLTPIAAVVAAQVGGEVNLQRQGTVSGVDSPKWEAWYCHLVWDFRGGTQAIKPRSRNE
jgi:hypothetical protein